MVDYVKTEAEKQADIARAEQNLPKGTYLHIRRPLLPAEKDWLARNRPEDLAADDDGGTP